MTRPRSAWRRLMQLQGGNLPALSAIGVSFLLLALGGDAVESALRYDRAALAGGELWRLVTGHVVHLGVGHALLNFAGLGLMWALFRGDLDPWRWLAVIGASVGAIDAGLWFLRPDLAWYVGASGALHGIMAAGTLVHWRRGDWDRVILAVFLVAKLTWEQTQGALPLAGVDNQALVIVDAHLYGAIGGLLAALWLKPNPRPL